MTALSSGRSLLSQLKTTAGLPGPPLCIPIGKPCQALLRPVPTRKELLNPQDIRCLTLWRNQYVKSFLTEFSATEERTAQWLIHVVGPDETKILFMLDDLLGRTFGYMGVAFIDWDTLYGEADAIVRGGPAPPGTMSVALRTLMSWACHALGLMEIGVRVRSDNTAVQFYSKLGFRERKRVPLNKVFTPDGVRWFEDIGLNNAEASLVYMSFPGATALQNGQRIHNI